jgi:hypothetical protein
MSAGRVTPRLIGLALVVLLSGCASIPTTGPIQTLDQPDQRTQAAPFDFTPAGPAPGATPAEVVQGFMTAQLATPVTSFVAREFLTSDSASAWTPDAETLVFDSSDLLMSGTKAVITLSNPIVLDKQGRWMGPASNDTVVLHLQQEKGEWRIASPPNVLLIPRSHFDQRFQRYSLFFFDRTGQYMVSEPVYLPWGVQAPTRLVSALLLGPPSDLSSVERTYLPRGTQVDFSVPVDSSGVAVVPLTTSATGLSGQDQQRAVAQVATTLGQLANVSRVQLTVGGQPLDYPGMANGVAVGSGAAYDPNLAWTAHDIYGLEGKSVVSLTDTTQSAGSFPDFPDATSGRTLAVAPNGQRAAVVVENEVYTASSGADAARASYQGIDIAPPHYDLYGNLWIYDRGAPARVRVLQPDGNTVSFPLQLPPGFVPRSTALSNDGTRWLVTGEGGIVTFRVRRSSNDGLPLGLTSERVIDSGSNISSVAFVSSTRMIAVRNLPGVSDMPFLQFDGSPDGASPLDAPREGLRVFAVPSDPPVIYASVGRRLITASTSIAWVSVVTDGNLEYPTLAG